MHSPLIINARGRLAWHQRLFSDASTLALWSMWLWMCRPALMAAVGVVGVLSGLGHGSVQAALPGTMWSLEEEAFALLGTGALLMLWNWLSTRPAPRPAVQATPDYAAYFGLSQRALAAGRDSRVCVVHHDEQGRIVRLESLPPEGGPRTADAPVIEYAAAA